MSRTDLMIIAIDYTETPNLITTIRAKALDGSTHELKVEGIQPRFWTEKDPTSLRLPDVVKSVKPAKFTSVDGKPLWEIRVDLPSQISQVRDFLFPHYCADVSWPIMVRWIADWPAVISIPSDRLGSSRLLRSIHIRGSDRDPADFSLNALYYDIETADSLDMDGTPEPIVSIAIYDERTGTHECATIRHTSEAQVKRFLSSQKALHTVVEHDNPIPPLDPERIKVFNMDGSDDIERECALLWWFKHRIDHYDPDVIAGQNIIGYDHPYVKNRCRNQRRLMERKYGGKVPVWATYPRLFEKKRGLRPCFDTKKVYAEQVQGAAATTGSASLAWMGASTLGYGKVPRTSIKQMMESDPMMLVVYNIWDNVVAARCMEELDLLSFYQMKVAFHNSTFHSAHSNMMLVEDMMGHLLKERGAVMPSVDTARMKLKGDRGIEQGAFIMDAPSGLFRNAIEVDNSMEYPSVIITCNADPMTKVNIEDYPDGFPFPVATTPLGTTYRQDIQGVMPTLLRSLAHEREQVRSEMRDAFAAGDDKLGKRLDQRQRVMKENMNSWYGVLGSGRTEKTSGRPFRIVDGDIGSDITDIARRHNDWNKRLIDGSTLLFTQDGVYPDPQSIENENIDKPASHGVGDAEGFRLRFRTIYQDTDSCKMIIENHDEAEATVRPFTQDDVKSIGNILCRTLNASFDRFVQETIGVDKNEFFRIKPDEYYDAYFQWGVKKRYAYRNFDGKYGYRGVEMRRSSSPTIVKKVQEQIFNAVLSGADRTELNTLIRQMEDDMLDPEKHGDEEFGQPMGVKKEGTQAHKAAMWSNQHLDQSFALGDKPVMFLSKETKAGLPPNRIVAIEWGDDPADFGIVVDRPASIEKFFVKSNSFKSILNAMGTSWEKARAGISVSNMGDWFA